MVMGILISEQNLSESAEDPAPPDEGSFILGQSRGEKKPSPFYRKWRNPKMGLWVLFWAEKPAAKHVAICAGVMIEGMFM